VAAEPEGAEELGEVMKKRKFKDLVALIQGAPGPRLIRNLSRRLIKLMEEVGELAQAYLMVSSRCNPKRKTWAQVREEALDAMIIAADIAMTPLPGENRSDLESVRARVEAIVERKIRKWRRKHSGRKEVTLDEGRVGFERLPGRRKMRKRR